MSSKYIASFIWLAGVLGISVKGAGKLLGTALKDVEGWLWQAELDESIADAAAYLPKGVKHKRLTGNSVGNLISGDQLVARNDRPAAIATEGQASELLAIS
jgi:hypothetical protein